MRWLHLPMAVFTSAMLLAQAPSWQWARSFPLSGYNGAISSLAQDSGYFLSLDEQELELPWGLVESSTAMLLHMDALGEPTAAVAVPPIMRMLPAGENHARFLISYRDSCMLPEGTLVSPIGKGVAMGVVDATGSISEVVNMSDLAVCADCAIGDLDLAPNGDLLLAGWFRGTVQCGDSTFLGDGYFLCRFTSSAQLVSAVSIQNPTLGSVPIVRVVSDGDDGAYVAMQEFASPVPDPIFGAGTIIASFDNDWGLRWSRSSTDQIGLYSDGPVYIAKSTDGGLYAAYTSAPSAFWPGRVTAVAYTSDGSERWLNNSFGPEFEIGASSVMGITSSPAFNGPIVSVYTYGQMEGYGPYPITNNGSPNAVVSALDSIGQWKWAISDNGPGNVFGTQAVASPNGTIYASGVYEIGGALGSHPLISSSPVSLFVSRTGLGAGPVGVGTATATHDEWRLNPNPATDRVWLQSGVGIGIGVQLCDVQGRMLRTFVVGQMPFPISVADLAPGIYLVCSEGRRQRIVVE